MVVRVHRNLHTGGYSVQHKPDGRGWRLFYHTDCLVLTNVTFKVYEKARQRVILQHKKNVHAFVIGNLSPEDQWKIFATSERVSYNPYRCGHFYRITDMSPIYSAKFAYFTLGGVYVNA